MKPGNAKRAHILCQAIEELGDLEKEVAGGGYESWDYFGLALSAGGCSFGNESISTSHEPRQGIMVDQETAALVLPLVRALITEELKKLEVEV